MMGWHTVGVMFRGLDWQTETRQVNLFAHWRMLLCAISGGILSALIWRPFFPHTFWFDKFWSGMATGCTVGMFPGIVWQLHDDKRRPITSGWLIVLAGSAWSFFACFALAVEAPDLYYQEQERSMIRSLTLADIAEITVQINGQPTRRIKDAEMIASFVKCSKKAELFYPSHEGSIAELELTIYRVDGTSLHYNGRIPERHQNDFSIHFRSFFAMTELIFPGGRTWLDSVTRTDSG